MISLREFYLLTSWQRGEIDYLRFLVEEMFEFIGCYTAGSSVTGASVKITLASSISSSGLSVS